MKSFVTAGAKLWHMVFLIIMVTTIPFLAGNGTGFLFMALVGMILSIVG